MNESRTEKRRYGRGGFTLVEVLLVVAILGILSTVVVVNVAGKQKAAMIRVTRTSIAAICTAIKLYEVDTGQYPASLDALIHSDGSPNWSGPYVEGGKLPVDSWGTPFSYAPQGEGGYKVTSAGPDKNAGSGDDITN